MTLPMAMSLLPFFADTMLVANSGSEVPPATMVRPITASDTPRVEAINEALSTNRFEPKMRHTKPTTSSSVALPRGAAVVFASVPLFLPYFTVTNINTANRMKSNAASSRSMPPSRQKMSIKSDANTANGISRRTLDRFTMMGATSAEQPTMSSVFSVFDPTTLPTARSGVPFRADTILTHSSGIEVPIATMVKPITIWLTPKRDAMFTAPSVSQSAPFSTATRPITSSTMFISMLPVAKLNNN